MLYYKKRLYVNGGVRSKDVLVETRLSGAGVDVRWLAGIGGTRTGAFAARRRDAAARGCKIVWRKEDVCQAAGEAVKDVFYIA